MLTPSDTFALSAFVDITNYTGPRYSTDSTDVVTATEGGVVTALAPGTAIINADIEKYDLVRSAESEIHVVNELQYNLKATRTVTGITIPRKPRTIEVGEEFVCHAYILSGMTDKHPYPYGYADDNLVKFSSSDASVCRVKNGVLLGVAPGVATITASDLDGNVAETFEVMVSEPTTLEYTEEQVLKVDTSSYDWSTIESTTLAIRQILADAFTAGMRKVVFPKLLYNVSPTYGTIEVPTQMIVDFSGSVIQIKPSAMTTEGGYVMFRFTDTNRSSIVNATIYGERNLIEGTGVEGCVTMSFSGTSTRSGLDNCTISQSPGFNIGLGNRNRKVVGVALSGIAAGGIDDFGTEIAQDYAYRSSYTNISKVGNARGQIWLGNVQGYGGYLYLSARVYDLHFYDVDKKHISVSHNCIQYYPVIKPDNAVYARIVFWQGSAPTSGDPDYHAVAHFHSFDKPDRCYIRNCVIEDNYSTGMTINGGENTTVEGCLIRNNGYRDPHAAINIEDARQHGQGNIIRNNVLSGNGGPVHFVGGCGNVIHNNTFDGVDLVIGSEVQYTAIWLNTFVGSTVGIVPKTDMVFSQNVLAGGSTTNIGTVDGVSFAVRMAANIIE